MVKPVTHNISSHCRKTGHHPSSEQCLARAPPEVQDLTQVFCGGADPLSNLHVCLEGCTWTNMGVKYNSIEKEFQHNKIESHGFDDEVNEILGYENPVDIMYHSKELISEDDK